MWGSAAAEATFKLRVFVFVFVFLIYQLLLQEEYMNTEEIISLKLKGNM